MSKKVIDLKKLLKPYYSASTTRPAIVDLPTLRCLMVDGMGDPNGEAFRDAVGSISSVAYTLKFTLKKERSIEYPVMPLQGLWSADDMNDFLTAARDRWKWTLLVVLPDAVTRKDVAAAAEVAKKKAKSVFSDVRFEKFAEGRAAQVMHLGPYAAERPTIDRLHAFIAEQGYRPRGRHHEIYLGDPRRSAPEKLRTIIRQPMERVGRQRSADPR